MAITAQDVSYNQTTWADGSSGGTPITAAQLNRIETGVNDLATQHNALVSDATSIDSEISGAILINHQVASIETDTPPSNVPEGITLGHVWNPGVLAGQPTDGGTLVTYSFLGQMRQFYFANNGSAAYTRWGNSSSSSWSSWVQFIN